MVKRRSFHASNPLQLRSTLQRPWSGVTVSDVATYHDSVKVTQDTLYIKFGA